MDKEPKNWSEHPAYQEEDLEIKNEKELEEAKEIAGVTSHEDAMERFRAENSENEDDYKPKKVKWSRDDEICITLQNKQGNKIIVEVMIIDDEDGVNGSYQICFPGVARGWESYQDKKPISEILEKIEKEFGIEIPPRPDRK